MSGKLAEAPQNTDNSAISVIENLNLEAVQTQLRSIESFQSVVSKTLVKEQDYGVISGTEKPTLLKPGAEKILMILGLSSEYSIIDKVENYDNGFFAYTIQATLYKNGQLITQGMGSANTRETRYRKNTYKDNKKIAWDGKYQDAYTLQNTVLKMAKKRAQVDATLTVASLSNVFTQDMEDNTEAKSGEEPQMVITFGKYKGQTLEEIYKKDTNYIEWLAANAKKPEIRKAASMTLEQKESKKSATAPTHVAPSPELIHATEQLANEIASAEKITKEEVLKNNGIEDLKLLSPEQCERLKKKLSRDLQADNKKATDQSEQNADVNLLDDDLPF